MKIKPLDVALVLSALRALGGIALTSNIKTAVRSMGVGDSKVRAVLRSLEQSNIVKTDRPLYPDSIELRWEIVSKK